MRTKLCEIPSSAARLRRLLVRVLYCLQMYVFRCAIGSTFLIVMSLLGMGGRRGRWVARGTGLALADISDCKLRINSRRPLIGRGGTATSAGGLGAEQVRSDLVACQHRQALVRFV